MDIIFKKAIYVSCGLHFGLLALLGFYWFIKPSFQIEPTPFAFSLVEAETIIAGAVSLEPPALGEVDAISFDVPITEPLPDLPEIQPPDPVLPVATVTEKVAPPKNSAEASTKPPVKKVTYDDFAKKKGLDKPQSKPAAQKSKTIDSQKVKSELADVLKPKGSSQGTVTGKGHKAIAQGPVIDSSVLARFNAELRSKIDAVWLKPHIDTAHECITIVEFSVAPNGLLSQVKIVKSSGQPLFDRSVLDAFARLKNAGKPPHKEGGVYRLSFALL